MKKIIITIFTFIFSTNVFSIEICNELTPSQKFDLDCYTQQKKIIESGKLCTGISRDKNIMSALCANERGKVTLLCSQTENITSQRVSEELNKLDSNFAKKLACNAAKPNLFEGVSEGTLNEATSVESK